jgi:uncharacterized phage protein (TIGR01671 family)
MRPIKFRAYHKEYREIYQVFAMDSVCGDFHIPNENVKVVLYIPQDEYYKGKVDQKLIKFMPDPVFEASLSDIELMQYTGLHDKNGKEIYESDIVKSTAGPKRNPDGGGIAVVEWLEDEENDRYWWRWTGWSINVDDSFAHSQYLEVIGNIYETPELLEERATE